MSDLDVFIKQFVAETYENLDKLDGALIELEKNPRAADKIANIFRIIHSIKGTTTFFGFSKLGELTHTGETLLSHLRDGVLVLNSEMATVLLALVDAVREIVSSIEQNGSEGEGDYKVLLGQLGSLSRVVPAKDLANVSPASAKTPKASVRGDHKAGVRAPGEDVSQNGHRATNGHHREKVPSSQPQVQPEQRSAEAPAQGPSASAPLTSNIRIDVEQLDKLMNLAGELVLARNQILQYSITRQDDGLTSAAQRLNLITTELQEGIMKARMQPIDNVWSKFPRIVRDLAALFGKRVRLEMEGSETELDRTIIEAIHDPLTHLVRNCVDHGIETPEARSAAGKRPEGHLLLRAFHEGGQVNIEISDDGAGIDPGRLMRRAVDLRLLTAEQAQRLDERAALNLIFLPGFSTAEKITNVSGRGVGMDVVKTNIEKIGGMVDVESKLSAGTTLKIRIPLTLAIIPALVVTSGGQRYAIPQTSVLELVRLASEKAAHGIEKIQGAPVYRLRGNLLPLIYLNDELRNRVAGLQPGAETIPTNGVANIVVLRADNQKFGLVVDEVNDTAEIVVKPLSKGLKGISIFAGATIMGDGRVALILDVVSLARRAHVLSQSTTQKHLERTQPPDQAFKQPQSLLLFTTEAQALMAIPLSLVTRLEEFPRGAVESTGGHEVVQYQGQILPLIELSHCLRGPQSMPLQQRSGKELADKIYVVVYSGAQHLVGLKVDRIVDIVEERILIKYPPTRKGSLGSVVTQGRVAEILDLKEVLNLASFAPAPASDLCPAPLLEQLEEVTRQC